jgi:hypothetical protein
MWLLVAILALALIGGAVGGLVAKGGNGQGTDFFDTHVGVSTIIRLTHHRRRHHRVRGADRSIGRG